MRAFVLSLLCWALLVSSAASQPKGRWLVLPSTSGANADWVDRDVVKVRAALVATGADVVGPERAAERFEAEASAPPTALGESELERWMSLSGDAVNDLAEGNYDEALLKLDAAQAISRKAIEELNQEPERARRVFDTCLYMVRAVLATESESRARALARECRQLVPRAEPSPYMHPPPVTDILRRVDASQAKQTGALRLESDPSGCPARMNGVLLGETPVSMGEVFPGTYRVQVECDPSRRGRVHFVTVGAGRTERRVDARFDEVIVSRPALRLRYATTAAEQEHRIADSRRVAEEVRVDAVVLASMPTPETMELELIDVTVEQPTRPLAFARMLVGVEGPAASDLASAARALISHECTDFTSTEPTPLPCASDAPIGARLAATADDWPEDRRPKAQFVAGMTLVAMGLAGLGTGYVLLIPRHNTGATWVNNVEAMSGAMGTGEDPLTQQKWFNLGTGIIVSASLGSAALVSAMPLALPERDKTPWWAWVSGGAGIGLAAFSVAWGVTAEDEPATQCSTRALTSAEVRACFNRGEQLSVALLTGLSAAPLITMPLVYLFRPSKAKLEPRVEVGRSGAYLGVHGRF